MVYHFILCINGVRIGSYCSTSLLKHKCLHIGYNNPNFDYFMGDVHIESIDMEKDLGVHINKSLKVKEQVNYSQESK